MVDKDIHKISLETVIKEIKKHTKYKDRYCLCQTFFKQDAKRWSRRRIFEENLATHLNGGRGIKYFAYIKFYLDEGKKYALVGGKTGSKLVNIKSDVCFLSYPKKGKAKKWLYENRKEWDVEEILIIWALAEDEKENEREAFEIEWELIELFGLYKS